MDDSDKVTRPGHKSFLALHLILWSIVATLVYFAINLPFYVFLLTAIAYLYYTNTQINQNSVFIREGQTINVVVVGSGFSGITMGLKLKEAGIPFRILEKSSEIGGTWDANRYPGCACDVYSPLYQVSLTFKQV